VQILVDRDSVCMGDDVDSHQWTLDVDPDRTLGSLVSQALREYRLASAAGEVEVYPHLVRCSAPPRVA